jgi:hypothetical protein
MSWSAINEGRGAAAVVRPDDTPTVPRREATQKPPFGDAAMVTMLDLEDTVAGNAVRNLRA